jgi:hypothetical protein
MKHLIATALSLLVLSAPSLALSQQADQPKYRPGDWWKVKTEFQVKNSSRNEGCQDSYAEWLVKIDEKGLARLYGINDGKEIEATCDTVMAWIFGANESRRLKFPLSAGQTWTHRYERRPGRRTIQVDAHYKIHGWEKVQTPKGIFEAVKISGSAEWISGAGQENFNKWIEYYAPAKGIVFSESETAATKRKVMLVDFKVSP